VSANSAAADVGSSSRQRELLLAVGAIAAVAAAVATEHVLNGGLYSDDWGFAGDYLYADPPRYLTAVRELLDLSGGRPVLALLHPLPYAIFGAEPRPHLALAAILAGLVAVAFCALLRLVGFPLLDATIMGLLALLFPWSDSDLLWPTASINNVALLLLLTGALLGVRSIDIPGRRGGVLHSAATLLYVLSVLAYEAVAVGALLAGALYLRRGRRRRALTYWAVDVLALVAALVYDWIATASARGVPHMRARVEALDDVVPQAATLAARAALPGAETGTARAVVLSCLGGVAVVAIRRRKRNASIRCWLLAALGGLTTVAAAYVAISGSGLLPLSSGVDNRGNILAALGFAVLIYAMIRLAALIVFRRPGRSQVAATAVALALLGWYGHNVRADAKLWDRAAERQDRILSLLRSALPVPERGTTIYLHGSSAQVAPGIPVFSEIWDFNGAVKILYDDGSLRGFPLSQNGLDCKATGVHRPLGTLFGKPDTASYGRVLVFDGRSGTITRVRDAAECRTIARRIERARSAGGA
jgi:hypothetical protein